MKQSNPIHSKISPWLSALAYPVGYYGIMPLYFSRIDVIGRENIPHSGPVIIAPTHRSRWDALVVPYAVGRYGSGRDLRFMVTATEVQGVQGWFIKRLGGFPINLERSGISSLRHSVEILSQGEMLTIFPEGGIFRDTKVHPLKRGIARIALAVEETYPNSGIKILPLSIKYSDPSAGWRCRVTVTIGTPVEVSHYNSTSIKKSSEQLTAALEAALTEIHQGKSNPKLIAIA